MSSKSDILNCFFRPTNSAKHKDKKEITANVGTFRLEKN